MLTGVPSANFPGVHFGHFFNSSTTSLAKAFCSGSDIIFILSIVPSFVMTNYTTTLAFFVS